MAVDARGAPVMPGRVPVTAFTPQPSRPGFGTVTALPEAGSPLMKQLVAFIQRMNPASAITEQNVGTHVLNKPGVLSRNRPGTPFVTPQSRRLYDMLVGSGLATAAYPRPPQWYLDRFRNPIPSGAGQPAWTGFTPAAPIVGTYAQPQVPVATLPEPAPVSAPGGLPFPPGPAPMGAVDPEPPFGTPEWFRWRYGASSPGAAARQVRANLAR